MLHDGVGHGTPFVLSTPLARPLARPLACPSMALWDAGRCTVGGDGPRSNGGQSHNNDGTVPSCCCCLCCCFVTQSAVQLSRFKLSGSRRSRELVAASRVADVQEDKEQAGWERRPTNPDCPVRLGAKRLHTEHHARALATDGLPQQLRCVRATRANAGPPEDSCCQSLHYRWAVPGCVWGGCSL